MRYKIRFIIGLIIIIGIALLHGFGVTKQIDLQKIQFYAHRLEQLVSQRYFLSVLMYIGLFMLATITALPVTVLMTITSGFLFGTLYGALYTIIAATSGGLMVFFLVRYVIGDFIQTKYEKELILFNEEIEIYGHWYLLVLQIMPITPAFLPYALPGLTKMSWWDLIWATALGILPGTLIYTWFGNKLHTISSLDDLISLPIIIVLFLMAFLALLPVLWLKYKKSK